jgi:hypothetical protein
MKIKSIHTKIGIIEAKLNPDLDKYNNTNPFPEKDAKIKEVLSKTKVLPIEFLRD